MSFARVAGKRSAAWMPRDHWRKAEQSDGEPPFHTNRQIAFMILAVMVLMASIALAFALRTTQFRRANDNKGQESSRATPQAAVRPADWAGLGYIPDDVHALLGIDVARLGKSAVGQALMQRLNVGNDVLIGQSVDRLLVGLNWKELLPRVTAVVYSPTATDHKLVTSKISGEALSHGRWKLTKTTLLRNFNFWFAEADHFTEVGAQPAERLRRYSIVAANRHRAIRTSRRSVCATA